MSGKLKLVFALACAVCAVGAPSASASVLGPWLPGAGPQDLSSPSASADELPSVAASASGFATAVWQEDGGSGYEIRSATRPAGGSSFVADLQPLSVTGSTTPAIDIAPDGLTVVAWRQNSSSEIAVSTRAPGASAFGTPDVIASSTYASAPAIVVAPNGTVTVAWTSYNGGAGRRDILVATRAPGAATFDPQVTFSGTDDASQPALASGPSGTVLAWWDNTSSEVRVRSMPPGGTGTADFDGPVTIATAVTGFSGVSAAEGPDGNALLAWNQGPAIAVYTRPAGSTSSSGFTLDTTIPASAPFQPSVVTGPGGAAIVTFADQTSPNTTALQASRAPGATSFSAPQDVSKPYPQWGDAYEPYAAFTRDGSAAITWFQREAVVTNKDAVLAIGRGPGETTFDTATTSELSSGVDHSDYPVIAGGGDGTFNVVWTLFSPTAVTQARWAQLATQPLSVTKTGSGSGTVTSSPAGIDCGSSCSARFDAGSQVTLTAAAASGSKFAGWGGDCSGTSTTCTVTMSRLREVNAEFAPDSPTPPTPPAPPSNSFTQGTSSVNGSRVVTPVRVPGPGRITQSATRRSNGRTVSACRAIRREPAKAGTYRLACVLNQATRNARKKGVVRIRIRTTYTPSGGTPRTRLRTLVLPSLKPHYTG